MPNEPVFQGFQPEAIQFLTELRDNNNREWFQENKHRYEDDVQIPAFNFIHAMEPRLHRISKHFTAEAKKVGGSMMRIYKDTRFSKDKTPYKTNVGIQFRHEQGKDVHAPGFYVHFEPGEVFLGVGIWHPDNDVLAKIRENIDDKQTEWKKLVDNKAFKNRFELSGSSLKRPPKGYDKDHPLIEDLKRKDFIAVTNLDEATLLSEQFIEEVDAAFQTAGKFMEFLCRAMDLRF